MEVTSEQELEAEIREFIDRIIVPLLIERLLADTEGLYGGSPSYYDETQAA
jgi:hypothetical protein